MGKRNILLLEDQDTTRRSMANLLRAAGHNVSVARNALEAQALCAEIDHDVALLDVELPGLQVGQRMGHLYLKDTSPDTRIIFVSGKHGLAGLDRYGPDVHFLRKPIQPDELLDDLIHATPEVLHS